MAARLINLSDVWKMLNECASGHRRRTSSHYHLITYRDHTARLPLGQHGARKDATIETGHVRQLARHLGILNCAKEHLEFIF